MWHSNCLCWGERRKTEQIVPDGCTKSLLSCCLEASRGTVGRQGLRVRNRGGSRGTVLVGGLLVGGDGGLVGLHWGLVGGTVGVSGLFVGGSGGTIAGLVAGLRSEEEVSEDGGFQKCDLAKE